MSLMSKYTDSTFYHSDFRVNWIRTLKSDTSTEDTSNWVRYDENKKIYACDDLKDVLKLMDGHPDDKVANNKVFEDYIPHFKLVSVKELPEPFMWYNKTIDCINLRPGRLEGSNYLPQPIKMKGQNSHGIIAGRTGSGKSVFLNNLILNMMCEYSPWELELYLADFKKVEMSRYMDVKHPSPHVRACAATSEVDYVQSLIKYIKEKKDDREKLFARLGFQNIEQFREAYNNDEREVVMPRILFIADEFQQLFLDADINQKVIIDDLVTDITRKGRSQGVHLLFASQDMQGALTQKQLSNFKVRFCLACDAGISADVLGNNGATTLRLGQVIANTKSTEKVDNIIYGVPLSEDNPQDAMMYEDNYFSRLLLKFVDFASQTNYQYRQTQKFYDEDRQIDIENLESLLETPSIKNSRMFKNSIDDMKQNYMSFILGRKVIYSLEQYDIENFYISYGKNRCVLCISSDSKDLALFQKLVAINLKTMMFDEDDIDEMNRPFMNTMFFDLNPLVSALYPERDRIVDFNILEKDYNAYSDEEILDIIDENFYYRAEELNVLEIMFSFKKRALQAIRNSNNLNAKDVCVDYIVTTVEILKKDLDYEERNKIDTDEIVEKIEESGCFDSVATNDPESILYLSQHLEFIEDIEFESNFYLDENFQNEISNLLIYYYRYRIKNIRTTYKLFKPILVMITGIENLERLPPWFAEYASSGMDYNILTMFFSTTSVQYDVKLASNYIFIAGEDPKLYDDYIGKKPPKGNNALKYRCLIKNTNQTFAFKKYRWISKESTAKTLNFDALMG